MMRKLLSFFILFFLAKSFAQEYVPLLQQGNKWYEYNEYYSDGLGEISLTSIFINGEEIKNGVVYKKLYSNLYSKCINRYAYPTACFSTGNADEFYKLIRENTAERKVYFYDEATNSDVLLYDFSLNVGDLLPLNFPFRENNSSYNPDDMVTVSQIVKNGKVFNQSVPNTYLTQEGIAKIYEGIGSNTGLFYIPGKPIFEGGNVLNCFETLASGKSCESNFLSLKENSAPNEFVLVYLKDHHSFKVIGKSSEKLSVQFYDFSGKLLETKNVISNVDFQTNTIFKGAVFMYKVTSSSSKFTGKILIP